MTAITPSCAHAYQLICLTGHIPATTHSKFRLLAAKARYPHLPNVRPTTRERGNFQGWAICTDGSTDGVLSHELPMEEFLSCLVQLSRPKLILHSQVPGSTPIIPLKCLPLSKRSLFSGPRARLLVTRTLVFSTVPSMLSVSAWAQFMLARMFRLDSLANRYCSPAQATIHHATRRQSRGESWKRMCGSCFCAGCIWLGVEP